MTIIESLELSGSADGVPWLTTVREIPGSNLGSGYRLFWELSLFSWVFSGEFEDITLKQVTASFQLDFYSPYTLILTDITVE
jgi:hypothetical protein